METNGRKSWKCINRLHAFSREIRHFETLKTKE